ncbi:MAG TPA: hypothetical protein VFH31_05200 [Pyrinomonadaceae bacterium]|nr:hypothetical protein [Pyrinomonadaceae bacterium]
MATRRFCLYFSWSRPGENGASLGTLDNRFPALFEFRRAIWPHYEHASDPSRFQQDILGFLDHVVLFDFQTFRNVIQDATGILPEVVQRESAEGKRAELNDQLLENVDTLIVVSLDHLHTSQSSQNEELQALRRFLQRPGATLIVCPHHDVGATDDAKERIVEHTHHGDMLVPSQQRLGGFARSVLAGLELQIENRFGLSPAKSVDGSPAPLRIAREDDELGVLEGVTTFNIHGHLPHLEVREGSSKKIRILARQVINTAAPVHPFVEAGNDSFNALLWAPPEEGRAGNVFVGDATLWSSAFGGSESLTRFWQNLAKLPLVS